MMPILVGRGLTKRFGEADATVTAVDNVDIAIEAGELVMIMGDSGCGKTTAGKLLVRLLKPTAGRMLFKGSDIRNLEAEELRLLRRRMPIIFQDPYASLNPRMRVE